MPRFPFLAFSLMFALGCVTEEQDGRDDVVVGDAKSDAYGLVDGTYLSAAITALVNHQSADYLRNEVGLTPAMTTRILAARPFASLTALDAVPYTGTWFFDRLHRFVVAKNLIGSCGDGITQSNAGPEECDFASNTPEAVGCSPACRYDAPIGCGDGVRDPATEACDDGNTTPGDTCASTCQWEIANSMNSFPSSPHVRLVQMRRGSYEGGNTSFGRIVFNIHVDLRQATQYGLDLAAFHSLAWGGAPADWTAFESAVMEHHGTETFPRLQNNLLRATAHVNNGVTRFDVPLDTAANVSVLTPDNAAWDTTMWIQPGQWVIAVEISDWHYTAETWVGASLIAKPIATSGPVCGDGIQGGSEECDDGNSTQRDGCSSLCKLEAYAEQRDDLNGNRVYERTSPFRWIAGTFHSSGDQDVYEIVLAQPATIELLDPTTHASTTCAMFDGLLERVGDPTYFGFPVLETSQDTGCAKLSLPAGRSLVRVSEATPGPFAVGYYLRIR